MKRFPPCRIRCFGLWNKRQAKGLILDISTVETLDSFFARTVAETAQMVALMGGRTIIAGIRPSVAITATQLGFTLNNTLTALDVDRALDMLAGRAGKVSAMTVTEQEREEGKFPSPRKATSSRRESPFGMRRPAWASA